MSGKENGINIVIVPGRASYFYHYTLI